VEIYVNASYRLFRQSIHSAFIALRSCHQKRRANRYRFLSTTRYAGCLKTTKPQ